MTEKKNVKARAPAIAIGVIVLCAIAAEYWLVPTPESPVPQTHNAAQPDAESLPGPHFRQLPSTLSWPVYHGGTELIGVADAALPDKPGILWQYRAEGAIHHPPVGDAHGIYALTRTGTVIALDHEGKVRWTKQVVESVKTPEKESVGRFEAPIACFRSTALIGSASGILYALDTANGAERWTYNVGGPILGTANLDAAASVGETARLFVIKQDDGALHCINFDTGAPLWQGRPVARCDGSAAVGDGRVVYGSCASALHVYATGEARLLGNIELGEDCQVAAGPALVGDEVYSGSRSGKFFRINVRTGKITWTNTDSKKEVFTTPAVGQDAVIFGSEDGGVYALDRESGKLKWRFETRRVPTSPVLARDKVIVGAGGTLYFLKLDSGEEIWNYEVSDGIASPAIINGMVVVGSEDGTIMAFGDKPR